MRCLNNELNKDRGCGGQFESVVRPRDCHAFSAAARCAEEHPVVELVPVKVPVKVESRCTFGKNTNIVRM